MKVIVFTRTYVPGHGMGPFITPIEIDDPRVLALITRTGRIKAVKDKPVAVKPVPVEEEKVIEIPVIVDEIEPPVMEELEKELVEEVQPEEEVVAEEVIEEVQPEEEVEEVLTEEMLMEETVSQIKARLVKNNIDFLYKDTKKELIAKLLRNL